MKRFVLGNMYVCNRTYISWLSPAPILSGILDPRVSKGAGRGVPEPSPTGKLVHSPRTSDKGGAVFHRNLGADGAVVFQLNVYS